MKSSFWQKITKNPVVISSALLTVAYNLANFIHFIANFLLVKKLSVPLYGEYASTTAYVALFVIPLSIFALIIIQKVGAKRAESRKLYFYHLERRFWQTIKKYWWLWLGLVIVMTTALRAWANLDYWSSILYIVTGLLLNVLVNFYGACLQGEKNFKAYSLTMIVGAVIKVIGFAVIYLWWPNLQLAYLAIIISNIVIVYLQFRFATPKKSELPERKGRWVPIDVWEVLKRQEIWMPILTMIGVMAFINIDLILVKKFMTPEDAGLYGVISILAKTINYALLPVTQVIFAFGASREDASNNSKHVTATALVFVICGLLATIAYAVAPELIINLVAKGDYLVVAPYLWLAAIFGTLYTLGTLFAQYFINQRKMVALISVIFALLQVIGIVYWHDSFQQVLFIDIALCGAMVLTYVLIFAHQNKKNQKVLITTNQSTVKVNIENDKLVVNNQK